MHKKIKWAIPFAVLALTCGIAAGCGGHEHSYTEWGHNETRHWKQCPDDKEKDNSTVANHSAPNAEGKCPDCGYQIGEAHTHSYTKWGSSVTHHWKECPDDGEMDAATKALHGEPDAEGKCPDCGYQILTYIDQQCKLVLRKDGNNTEMTSLDGIQVKLSQSGVDLVENTDYQVVKGAGNALTIKGIVSGDYTVTIVTADGEYRFSETVKLDGSAEKEIVLQYNYAIASSQAYYVDLTHMNDTNRSLAINTSGVDGFWQWNTAVAEITLNLGDEIQNSKNVKLEFNLKAKSPNNQPNNAFGIVMTETYKGVGMSIWDTENENDGVKLHNLVGQKLGWDAYSSDGSATLKWLETEIYGENGVDVRVVRTENTLKYFVKNAEGKWIGLKSLACPSDAKTDIKFMGAGSDYTISNIEVDGAYTETAKAYTATLTVLDAQGEKVALAEGAKGLLIAGDTNYEVELTKNDDGTYAISGNFVPSLYSFSILGKVTGYASATVQVGDTMDNVEIKLGDFATATEHVGDGIQLADRVTVSEGAIFINGYHENGFWQWKTAGQSSNVVPAATLNLSDEIKTSRNVTVDFKLKATHPNNQPNNAFGIAMTELHNGAALSFWDTENEANGIGLYDLKGTWLGEDGWGDDKEGTFKWLETAIYGIGANFRAERNGGKITVSAYKDGAWVKIYETECYEYAETMIKFLGCGSDFEISGIKVRVPKEGEVAEYNVNASFAEDANHGYSVTVDPTVEEGGEVTLTIETSDANAAWSYFPSAVTVNGTPIDFSIATVESLGANRCRYTLKISDVVENKNVVVTVTKGTKVNYSATVNDGTMGSLVCDMENAGKEYYWNDACALTLTANEGYRLKNIVIGEGETAQTVTEGWKKEGFIYNYTFIVTGDIKIVATYEAIPVINLADVKISVVDKAGTVLNVADGTQVTLSGDYNYTLSLTKNADGTYSAVGNVYEGTYAFNVAGVYLGYTDTTTNVVKDEATLKLQLGDVAVATKYHSGDHHGMGEIDFETLIAVDANTVKINTANANGKVVDAFWCWNSEVPEASLSISDEVKNATHVQLEFNLKAANSNESPNNAFGIVMAEGYKGVNMSVWSANEKLAYYALTRNMLGNDAYGADKNTHDAWLKTAMYSETGVNIRVIRDGASIKFYAQNGEEWVKFFETTCDENAKTDIKFLGMGSDYTVSAIQLSTTLSAAAEVNVDVTVNITDGTNKIDLGESVNALLDGSTDYEVTLTKNEDGTYKLRGRYQEGEYKLSILGQNLGYAPVEIVIGDTTADINVQYALATATKYHSGAYHNMPEVDYEDLIDIKNDTIIFKTDAFGGKVVDAFWCWNSQVPEATLNVSEEVKNATNVTLEFNLKAANSNESPNNAFGIVMAEGYKGLNMSIWSKNEKLAYYALTGNVLGNDAYGADKNTHDAWLKTAMYCTNGVNIRAVRDGANIAFYAQNGEEWVKIFETTCDANAKTDIKFLGVGSIFTISGIDVVVPKIATATKFHHGDHNGMGEIDFETLIKIDFETVKINTANANGKKVDGFWCWNSPVPEATLNVSDEVKNAKKVTLEFNLKVANGNDSPNNAFGIAMAGYKGVAISLWNIKDNKIDLHELTEYKLGADGWGYADTYAAFGWIETLAEGANGVNLRAIRDGANITFYAQNAEGEWAKFFETTCDENAKTDIKFLGMGSDYTISNVSVTSGEQA